MNFALPCVVGVVSLVGDGAAMGDRGREELEPAEQAASNAVVMQMAIRRDFMGKTVLRWLIGRERGIFANISPLPLFAV